MLPFRARHGVQTCRVLGPYQHPAARRRLSGHRAVVVILQDHHVVGLAEFHRVLLRLTAAAAFALLAAVALAASERRGRSAATPGSDSHRVVDR